MESFTVRAPKIAILYATLATLFVTACVALPSDTGHAALAWKIGSGASILTLASAVFAFAFGYATKVDTWGVSVSWLGRPRPQRSSPWNEIRTISILPSKYARSPASKSVKVTRQDGRTYELPAPVAIGTFALGSVDRHFDASAKAIVDYWRQANAT